MTERFHFKKLKLSNLLNQELEQKELRKASPLNITFKVQGSQSKYILFSNNNGYIIYPLNDVYFSVHQLPNTQPIKKYFKNKEKQLDSKMRTEITGPKQELNITL